MNKSIGDTQLNQRFIYYLMMEGIFIIVFK